MSTAKVRKIAILGSRAVGKSSLSIQYVENTFKENYYPTIENTFTKNIKYKNQDFTVEIIDTAGQDEYSIFNTRHAIGIHGYILVYNIASKQSFEMLTTIHEKILNYVGLDWVPIVIVGNKLDLIQNGGLNRQVEQSDVAALAKEWNCTSTESSAKLNLNIDKIFESALNEIEKQNNQDGGPITSNTVTTTTTTNSATAQERKTKDCIIM